MTRSFSLNILLALSALALGIANAQAILNSESNHVDDGTDAAPIAAGEVNIGDDDEGARGKSSGLTLDKGVVAAIIVVVVLVVIGVGESP